MHGLKNIVLKLGIASELIAFLWRRKLWWLIPMVAVLLLFGVLMVFIQGTGIAPYIYVLF